MAEAAKYLFDVDLEADNTVEPPEEVRERELRAEFEQQLEAARALAHEEGRRQGEEEARNSLEAKADATLQQVLESAQTILSTLRNDTDAIRDEAVTTAVAAAQCLAGTLIERHPTIHAEAIFNDCLEHLGQAPHIAIRVHDSLADTFQEKAAAIAAQRGFAGKVIVLGDPETARGDCRIEWADGGISRNHEHLSLSIETIVRRHLTGTQGANGAAANGDGGNGAAPAESSPGQPAPQGNGATGTPGEIPSNGHGTNGGTATNTTDSPGSGEVQ